MDLIQSLPSISNLSPSTLHFLNQKFNVGEDLTQATNLVSELENQCCNLDQNIIDLKRRLDSCLSDYVSQSDRIGGLFGNINVKLNDLDASTRVSCSSLDGDEGEVSGSMELILGHELPALAKEVARVEAVRAFAETALKLDILVGDIEDAVSSLMNRTGKRPSSNAEDLRMLAIKSLKLTEKELISLTNTRPQWARMVSAVDHRVDRGLAILRPQAIADYRALLASLNWPPTLSTLNNSNLDTRSSKEAPNPLFTMQGDLKQHYIDNFLALCSLQELQGQRKSRQLKGYKEDISLHQPLWAIEELVNPISIASQHHFSKWVVDKPELIFALVYKVTRDYVDSMDELLQPLVDQAMLTGYSCREEWISGMVSSLSTYLAKELFPVYLDQLEEQNDLSIQSSARVSWLNIVDLMINFDKKVQSLVTQSGLMLSLQEDGELQRISSLSVFCDRPDWLDLWAEIELMDTLDKLKPDMDNERNWIANGPEDYKSPLISIKFSRRLSIIIDRCRSLPSVSLRSRFTRLACAPLVHKFLDCLLLKCQEADGLTALTDVNSLVKVTNSINGARYLESVLKDWSMDFFFLEMETDDGIFNEEIRNLEEFRIEWVKKISDAILRGFDGIFRDYTKNKKQWLEKGEDGVAVSKTIVAALDYLQGKVSVLEESLNEVDFVKVWRNLAGEIDKKVFDNLLMSNVKFNDHGVEKLGCDLEVLFGLFGAWCLRPEVFFPKASEGLKVLKMEENIVRRGFLSEEIWLKEHGISHLNVHEAEKIAKSRIFKG